MSAEHNELEAAAFVRVAKTEGWLKSSLLNMIGWQPGFALGTTEANALIHADKVRWMWDRTLQRLLDVRRAHPVPAINLGGTYESLPIFQLPNLLQAA